jgi:chromosomal replication initiation ATPase DnaA
MKRVFKVDVSHLPEQNISEIEEMFQENYLEYSLEEKTDMDILLEALQSVLHITIDDMKSCKRGTNISYARRIFFYHARRIFPNRPLSEIGRMIEKKQSSVSHSLSAFSSDIKSRRNKEFRSHVAAIEDFITQRKK